MVPHALGALSDTLGGASETVARLDTFFTYLNAEGVPFARLGQIRHGGEIVFDLDSVPHREWGSGPEDAPPSFGEGDRDVCAELPM